MNIYIVYSGHYEDRMVSAVYATLEDAHAAHGHDQWSKDGLVCEWHKDAVPAEPWPEMRFEVGVTHHYKAPNPGSPEQWCDYRIEEWTIANT